MFFLVHLLLARILPLEIHTEANGIYSSNPTLWVDYLRQVKLRLLKMYKNHSRDIYILYLEFLLERNTSPCIYELWIVFLLENMIQCFHYLCYNLITVRDFCVPGHLMN